MTPLPIVMGRPIRRDEVIEALWGNYQNSVELAKQDDPCTTGFPDMELVLHHIEEHGLPPKGVVE